MSDSTFQKNDEPKNLWTYLCELTRKNKGVFPILPSPNTQSYVAPSIEENYVIGVDPAIHREGNNEQSE